jgi:pimeloyl-ACP methyl ester carboxylesterase
MSGVRQESLFIPWPPEARDERLHVRRIFSQAAGSEAVPVLALHGAVENGRIFYSESDKGVAPFFAEQGFEVFVPDLRGRGQSTPHVSRRSRYGQFEAINQEIPAFVELIRSRRGDRPQVWMAHSWGGVLMLAFLARRPEYAKLVRGVVCFGTKRTVNVRNFHALAQIDFFWHRAARALVALHGYLPARAYGVGSDDESDLSHAESSQWVKCGPWIDPRDGFDYGKALREIDLPPLLFLAGAGDRCLGHPKDVRSLIHELGPRPSVEYRLLGRSGGCRHDYGHIDMLTGPHAREEVFAEALRWVQPLLRGA